MNFNIVNFFSVCVCIIPCMQFLFFFLIGNQLSWQVKGVKGRGMNMTVVLKVYLNNKPLWCWTVDKFWNYMGLQMFQKPKMVAISINTLLTSHFWQIWTIQSNRSFSHHLYYSDLRSGVKTSITEKYLIRYSVFRSNQIFTFVRF